MSRILFLSADSMSDALGAIGRSFAGIFSAHGHSLVEIPFGNPGGTQRLSEALQAGDILCALSFGGFGNDIGCTNAAGQPANLWEELGIPFVSLYGDTPAYYFDRHVMPGGCCASLYTFPEHLEFRRSLPNVRGMVGLIPMGPADDVAKSALDFKQKARGRLLFLKNGNDPEKLMNAWQDAVPPGTSAMLFELASHLTSRMASEDSLDVDAAVMDLFRSRGLYVEDNAALRLLFVSQLDDYLRRVKSTMMAKVLCDFPVDMFGHNWDHVDFRGKRINFTPGGEYAASTGMIRASLGMIDMSPNTGRAAHERVLRAFGAYTLCVTNRQEFLLKNVAHADEWSFRFDESAFREKIADIVARPGYYVDLGVASAEDFMAKFSPHRFPELVIEVAQTLRMTRHGLSAPVQPYLAWPPKLL